MKAWLVLQRAIALSATFLLLPVLVALAATVRFDSPGPALYLANRVGQSGRPIQIRKLRSMRHEIVQPGPAVTANVDDRVTRVGRWMRERRLDELPQFWDVACGRMALVGPRPEDPMFVDLADPVWIEVLSVLPGITGRAQLRFHDEGAQLSGDPHVAYRERILPDKLAMDLSYVRDRSVRGDLAILADTVRFALGRA